MSGFMTLVLAGAAGAGLGIFYFGGLWLTVRRLPNSGRPALLFLGSFAGRTTLALLGFYLVMDGRWERMLACLAGFIVVRQFLISRLRPEWEPTDPRESEGVQT
jgi:F1F0 ATPase subunit 2